MKNLIKNDHTYTENWCFENRVTTRTIKKECIRRGFNFVFVGLDDDAPENGKITCYLFPIDCGFKLFLK